MIDDPCPNCGYRRKRMLMSVDRDAPGFFGVWRGDGGPPMQVIAWIGTIVIATLLLAVVFHGFG